MNENKLSRKIILIVAFYLVSFIAAFVISEYVFNYSRIHGSRQQGEAEMIRLYTKTGGMKINEMEGYAQEMDGTGVRTSITPVSDDQTITLLMDEENAEVSELSYILTDINGEIIEEGSCPEVSRVDGVRQTVVGFQTDLVENKEYCLDLKMRDSDGETAWYYTRVISGSGLRSYNKLKFVSDFHDAIFENDATTNITDFIEYSPDSNSDDYRDVSDGTDSAVIAWGSLEPTIISDVSTTILNLDTQTAQIRMTYEIEVNAQEGNTLRYLVQEYYDVASSGSSESILNYRRTMEEVLGANSFVIYNNRLRLGMTDTDRLNLSVYGLQEPEEPETVAGQAEKDKADAEEHAQYNTYISFVADGGLWVYNTNDNILTQAFGFEKNAQHTIRNSSYLKHGIKTLRTEDNGDVYFAVYGYMYNGDREGQFGIAVNHYDRADGTYEEVLFIPYSRGFNALDRGLNEMGFINDDGELYISLEDKIYCFDTVTRKYTVVLENANSEDCAISGDGMSVVTTHRDDDGDIVSIQWRNLATDVTKTVKNDGKKLKLIGMLGAHLVYGVSDKEAKDDRIQTIYILDSKLNIVKEYTMEKNYISDAYVTGSLLTICRQTKDGKVMENDYIVYNEDRNQQVSVRNVEDEVRKNESWLVTEVADADEPVVLKARAIEVYRTTDVDFVAEGEEYTGYFAGKIGKSPAKYRTFAQAYMSAYNEGGVVLDANERMICRPSVREKSIELGRTPISIAGDDEREQERSALAWIMSYEKIGGEPDISGNTMLENMQKSLKGCKVVDMTGININQALSMVSQGTPLIVLNSQGNWCVVSGYGEGYIVVADSSDGAVVGYETDSVIEGIGSSGNVIYGYYK